MKARRPRLILIAIATVIAIAGPFEMMAVAQEPSPSPVLPQVARRARIEKRRNLAKHEQKIRRGRTKIRQILRDDKASAHVKQTATELNGMLDRRHALIGKLKRRHKEFLSQHQADVDELRELSRRAREINARLDSARDAAVDAAAPELAELKDLSARAGSLADGLRAAYDTERRARRRSP